MLRALCREGGEVMDGWLWFLKGSVVCKGCDEIVGRGYWRFCWRFTMGIVVRQKDALYTEII